MKKCDFTDTQIASVQQWAIKGGTESDIRMAIRESYPESDVDLLIITALEQFEKTGLQPKRVMLGFCIEATRDLYRRMVEIGDYANALRAIKQLHDLRK